MNVENCCRPELALKSCILIVIKITIKVLNCIKITIMILIIYPQVTIIMAKYKKITINTTILSQQYQNCGSYAPSNAGRIGAARLKTRYLFSLLSFA